MHRKGICVLRVLIIVVFVLQCVCSQNGNKFADSVSYQPFSGQSQPRSVQQVGFNNFLLNVVNDEDFKTYLTIGIEKIPEFENYYYYVLCKFFKSIFNKIMVPTSLKKI